MVKLEGKKMNILLFHLDNNLVKEDYLNNNVENLSELAMDEKKKRVTKNFEAYLDLIINFEKTQINKIEQLMMFLENDNKLTTAYKKLLNERKIVSRDLEYFEKKCD